MPNLVKSDFDEFLEGTPQIYRSVDSLPPADGGTHALKMYCNTTNRGLYALKNPATWLDGWISRWGQFFSPHGPTTKVGLVSFARLQGLDYVSQCYYLQQFKNTLQFKKGTLSTLETDPILFELGFTSSSWQKMKLEVFNNGTQCSAKIYVGDPLALKYEHIFSVADTLPAGRWGWGFGGGYGSSWSEVYTDHVEFYQAA